MTKEQKEFAKVIVDAIKQAIPQQQQYREVEREVREPRRPDARYKKYIEKAQEGVEPAYEDLRKEIIGSISSTILETQKAQLEKFTYKTKEEYKKIEDYISENEKRIEELNKKYEEDDKLVQDILKKEEENKKALTDFVKSRTSEKEKLLKELDEKTPEIGDYEKKKKLEEEIQKLKEHEKTQLEEITKLKEKEIAGVNEEAEKNLEERKKLNEEIRKSKKSLVKIENDFVKEAEEANKRLLEQLNEEQTALINKTVGSFKEVGIEAFETSIKEQKGVDEGLANYRKALFNQYEVLNQDIEGRKKLGLTDKKMEEVKQDLYDSYFSELNRQLERRDLDERTKKLLQERIKREQIEAGRATVEETYGQDNPLVKLVSQISDFKISRTKAEEQGKTELFGIKGSAGIGKIFNEILGGEMGVDRGGKKPFLEGGKPTADVQYSQTEGTEGTKYLETDFKKMYGKPEEAPTTPPGALTPATILNQQKDEAKRTEATLNETEQILEGATENVPLKVVITNIEEIAKKDLIETFSTAIKESMGEVISSELISGLEKSKKEKPTPKKGEVQKSEEEGSFIDVVSDVVDLIPGKKKGKVGKAGKAAKGAAKAGKAAKAAKGAATAGKAAKAASTAKNLLTAGEIATSAAGLGSAGAGAAGAGAAGAGAAGAGAAGAGTAGALGASAIAPIAITAAAGLAAGYAFEKRGKDEITGEEKGGVGTSLLNVTGYNDDTQKQVESTEKYNKELKESSKLGSRKERDVAFFEAQLKDLNKRKETQSGDELKETEELISKTETKLKNVKSRPDQPEKPKETAKTVENKPAETPSLDISKGVAAVSSLPSVGSAPQNMGDMKMALEANNKLTAETNQKLDILIKVTSNKDYEPTSITPINIQKTSAPEPAEVQSQSPAWNFRNQNRTIS